MKRSLYVVDVTGEDNTRTMIVVTVHFPIELNSFMTVDLAGYHNICTSTPIVIAGVFELSIEQSVSLSY